MFKGITTGNQVLEIATKVANSYAKDYHEKEEMVGQAAYEICRIAEKVREADNPVAFVFGVARNVCRRMWAQKQGFKIERLEDVEIAVAEADPGYFIPERLGLIQFLDRVSPETREAILRRLERNNGQRYETREQAQEARRVERADSKRVLRALEKYQELLVA